MPGPGVSKINLLPNTVYNTYRSREKEDELIGITTRANPGHKPDLIPLQTTTISWTSAFTFTVKNFDFGPIPVSFT